MSKNHRAWRVLVDGYYRPQGKGSDQNLSRFGAPWKVTHVTMWTLPSISGSSCLRNWSALELFGRPSSRILVLDHVDLFDSSSPPPAVEMRQDSTLLRGSHELLYKQTTPPGPGRRGPAAGPGPVNDLRAAVDWEVWGSDSMRVRGRRNQKQSKQKTLTRSSLPPPTKNL